MTTAQQRLEDLQAKKVALEREIQVAERFALEEKSRVGLLWNPNTSEGYHRIYQELDGTFHETPSTARTGRKSFAPVFRTERQAHAFGEAFQIMLEMRAQSGVMAPTSVQSSYVITPQRDGTVKILNSMCKDAIPSTIFARFDSRENAQRAINRVGVHRLVACAKTLAFFQ